MSERLSGVPEQTTSKLPNLSFRVEFGLPPVVGVLPETYAFLLNNLERGGFEILDPRSIRLIDRYFGSNVTLSDLRPLAQVTTRERVRQIIVSGMQRIVRNLPSELQERYREEDIVRLKNTRSPETRAKMSKALKGRVSPMAGKQHSEEARAKMSEALKGNWQDPDYRAKMSKALKGRVSPMAGKQHSEEARAKMSEARRGYWKNKKAKKE